MQRNVKRNPVIAVGLAVMVVILTASCATTGVPSKDDKDYPVYTKDYPVYTWTTQHAYDEVFQASQQACARRHALVTASDKDKGTIRCEYSGVIGLWRFEIHIKALKSKPGTQITFFSLENPVGSAWSIPGSANRYLSEVQAVLAGVGERPSESETPSASRPPPSSGTQVSPVAPTPSGAGSYTSPSCIGHGIGCQ